MQTISQDIENLVLINNVYSVQSSFSSNSGTKNSLTGAAIYLIGINSIDMGQSSASIQFAFTVSSVTGSDIYTIQVKLSGQFVVYYLKVNLAIVDSSVLDYTTAYITYPFKIINQGIGDRSENITFVLTNKFNGQSSNIQISSFLVKLSMSNPDGKYFYVDWQSFYNITHVTLMIKTADKNTISSLTLTYFLVDTHYTQYLRSLRKISVYSKICTSAICFGSQQLVDTLILYYQSSATRFFGLTGFNMTKNQITKWNLDLSNSLATDYSINYQQTPSIVYAKITVILIALRQCTPASLYFDPTDDICKPSCVIPYVYQSATNNVCAPCYYTCTTCDSLNMNSCTVSCNGLWFRQKSNLAPTFQCTCQTGYIDVGLSQCYSCGRYMHGCTSCTSITVCTGCDSTLGLTKAVPPNKCICFDPSKTLTRYGSCISLVGCLNYLTAPNGSLACTQCNSTLGFILMNYSCACADGYSLSLMADGFTNYCKYVCNSTQLLGWSHICLLSETTITYIGCMRIQGDDIGQLYFQLQPYNPYLQNIAYLSTLLTFSSVSTPTYSNIVYSVFSSQPTKGLIFKLRFSFSKSVNESQFHSLTFKLHLSQLFEHQYKRSVEFTIQGKNHPLVTYFGSKVSEYLMLVIIIVAFLIMFGSLLTQNWISIQLLQFYQCFFFYFLLFTKINPELFRFTNMIKYSTGYNTIITDYSYFDYESICQKMDTLAFRKESLLNINYTALLFLLPLILGIFKVLLGCMSGCQGMKRKSHLKKQGHWIMSWQFIIGKLYLTITLICTNQIMFAFFVEQTVFNSQQFTFNQHMDWIFELLLMLAVIFALGLLIVHFLTSKAINIKQQDLYEGRMSETSDEDLKEDSIFIFRRFSPSYPLVFMLFQILKITILSVLQQQSFNIEIILPIDLIYLIGYLIYRPYKPQKNSLKNQNQCYVLHNLHNIWNHISLIIFQIIIFMRDQQLITDSNTINSITVYTILIICFISEVFALLRLLAANKLAQIFNRKQKQKMMDNANMYDELGPLKHKKNDLQSTHRPLKDGHTTHRTKFNQNTGKTQRLYDNKNVLQQNKNENFKMKKDQIQKLNRQTRKKVITNESK